MVGIFPSLDIAKLVIRVPGSRASLGPRNDSRENRSSEPQHLSAADLAADRVLLLVVMAVTAVGGRNGRRRDQEHATPAASWAREQRRLIARGFRNYAKTGSIACTIGR